SRAHTGAKRVQIDLPLSVRPQQRIRTRDDRFETGEKVEQRIARLRYQHVVAGLAEQLEGVGVGLARARGQDNVLSRYDGGLARMRRGPRFARRFPASRRRLVDESRRV